MWGFYGVFFIFDCQCQNVNIECVSAAITQLIFQPTGRCLVRKTLFREFDRIFWFITFYQGSVQPLSPFINESCDMTGKPQPIIFPVSEKKTALYTFLLPRMTELHIYCLQSWSEHPVCVLYWTGDKMKICSEFTFILLHMEFFLNCQDVSPLMRKASSLLNAAAESEFFYFYYYYFF